jgi:hypothetical protein
MKSINNIAKQRIYVASFLSGPLDAAEVHYYVNTLIWTSKQKRDQYIKQRPIAQKEELIYTSYDVPRGNVPPNMITKYGNKGTICESHRGQPFGDYRHVMRFGK